ncbi:MAG TPA: thiamine phosphate synthase [Planctomycetaceae bacterium]|nr:thiamine phosphate synthase [Planctomycetaceae bacterium]
MLSAVPHRVNYKQAAPMNDSDSEPKNQADLPPPQSVHGDEDAYRVMDANTNRAAEGLRTIEDVARLVFEDQQASQAIKDLRHRLTEATQCLEGARLLSARSAATDAGTGNDTAGEATRNSWNDIVAAASGRVTQSLRTLEETSKLLPVGIQVVPLYKSLRYRAYDVLANLQLRFDSKGLPTKGFPADARLYVLIDCQREPTEFAAYVRSIGEAGVDVLQIRDKSAEADKLIRYADLAADATADVATQIAVNDRVDVALTAQVDGIHVGQEDLSIDQTRCLVGTRRWVGVSTHNLRQAKAAESAGADYIGCGPTFPSATKDFEAFAGPEFLRQVAEHITVPAFAIGGITVENVGEVIDCGIRRIAVSNVVHSARNPTEVVATLRAKLSG